MKNGVTIALLAYASFSLGDAVVKSLGGQLSVFVIGFFSTVSAGMVIFLLARPRDERWRDFWRMRRPWAVQARAATGVLAGLLGIFAFTSIPLAEAYALIFLAPLLVSVLSAAVLRERVEGWRWTVVAAGFAGVLLVVRPGLREVHPGHAAALGTAVCVAVSVVLLRSLAPREKPTSVLGTLMLYALAVMGIAVLVTAPPLPSAAQIGWLALAGAFAGLGQIGLLAAARRVPASAIAPAHYSQIAWAAALGAVFFGERPDVLAAFGLATIAIAGLVNLLASRTA